MIASSRVVFAVELLLVNGLFEGTFALANLQAKGAPGQPFRVPVRKHQNTSCWETLLFTQVHNPVTLHCGVLGVL
jgi:hypothetical protein